MSLLARPPRRAETSALTSGAVAPLRSPLALGALAAGQAVVGSLLCVLAPVVLAWMASSRTGASWVEAVRLAADAWLLAHGAGIAVDGGYVSLTPLGLTLLLGAWSWAAGRRIAVLLAAGPRPGRGGPLRALSAYTAGYALLAALLSLLAASPVARPVSGQALLGAAAVAAVGCAWGLSGPGGAAAPQGLGVAVARRLPARLRRVLPAVGTALAGWLGVSLLLAVVWLVLGWADVVAVHAALSPGVVGGAVLGLAQLLLLPVAVVWAAAWTAGPGFAVGAGTSVTVVGADLGPVPAVPLLGALPPASLPVGWLAVLALPVLAGLLAGVVARRRAAGAAASGWGGRGWAGRLADAGLVGAGAGVGAALLSWGASGAVGPGRMAELGPQPLAVGAALAAQVALGVLLAGLLRGTVDEPGTRLPGQDWLARRRVVRWALRRCVPLRHRLGTGLAAVGPVGLGRRLRSRIRRS